MPLMRDLEFEHRLNARSVLEVIQEKDRVVSMVANKRKVKFRGRKFSDEAFINAAVMALCALPADQVERVLLDQMERLEAILGYKSPKIAEPQPDTTKPVILNPPSRPRKRNG